jgi:hypothetical protein
MQRGVIDRFLEHPHRTISENKLCTARMLAAPGISQFPTYMKRIGCCRRAGINDQQRPGGLIEVRHKTVQRSRPTWRRMMSKTDPEARCVVSMPQVGGISLPGEDRFRQTVCDLVWLDFHARDHQPRVVIFEYLLIG